MYLGGIFFLHFLLLRWLSAPCRFFYCVFGRFPIRGTQKRDLKTITKSRPNKVRTYIVLFIYLFSAAPCVSQ
jgi:hypothetical protein